MVSFGPNVLVLNCHAIQLFLFIHSLIKGMKLPLSMILACVGRQWYTSI